MLTRSRYFIALRRLQEQARERRRSAGQEESEPHFSPQLARLRDTMLAKLDETNSSQDDKNDKHHMVQPDMAPAAESWDQVDLALRSTAGAGSEGMRADSLDDEEKHHKAGPSIGVDDDDDDEDEDGMPLLSSSNSKDKGKKKALQEIVETGLSDADLTDSDSDVEASPDDEIGFIPSPLTDPVLSQGYHLRPAQREADKDVVDEIVYSSSHTLAEEEKDLASPLIDDPNDKLRVGATLVDMNRLEKEHGKVIDEMDEFVRSRVSSSTFDKEANSSNNNLSSNAPADASKSHDDEISRGISKPYKPPLSSIPPTRAWERIVYRDEGDDDAHPERKRDETDDSSVDEEAEVLTPHHDSVSTLIGEARLSAGSSQNTMDDVGPANARTGAADKLFEKLLAKNSSGTGPQVEQRRKVNIVEVDSSDDEA